MKLTGVRRHLKLRLNLLLASVLGGGTMIIFPTATAAVVIAIALTIATIAMLAGTGALALASIAAAALLPLIAVALSIVAVVIAVRSFIRAASRTWAWKSMPLWSDAGDDRWALERALDVWVTDGGST